MQISGFTAEAALAKSRATPRLFVWAGQSGQPATSVQIAQLSSSSTRCYRLCVRTLGDSTLCGLLCGVIVLEEKTGGQLHGNPQLL